MLTAHQRIAILRRFPDADVSYLAEDSVFIRFSNGDTVWAVGRSEARSASVLAQRPTGYHSTFGPVESEDALVAERMLREFLGC